jgi:hypothetical protein
MTVEDGSELKKVIKLTGAAEEGTETVEQGEYGDGLDLGDYGGLGLGHGQKAKV